MARGVQRIGDLNQRIRVERKVRKESGDGAGNYEEGWAEFIASRAARIAPTRGGEELLANRLAGVESFDIWLRKDPQTRTIVVGDRIIDARDEARIFNIRWIGNLDERGRFLLLQAQSGVADE